MRPVICMITAPCQPRHEDALVDRIGAAARAGVHLIQVRQREWDGGALARLVERSVHAVASTAARVLVNDRIDVALAAAAHGVHLRGDSIPAERARPLVRSGFLIGRSVHSREEAARAAAEGIDYLVFGSVFPTPSKKGGAVAGMDALRTACLAAHVPVLAVGGITTERLPDVAAAGAAGFAAISLFADTPLAALPSVVQAARFRFDTPRRVP